MNDSSRIDVTTYKKSLRVESHKAESSFSLWELELHIVSGRLLNDDAGVGPRIVECESSHVASEHDLAVRFVTCEEGVERVG
jgi:hypothetical protein